MLLITASCTVLWTSIHSSSGTLSDLIPWIYLSLPLYNHKGSDLGHTWVVPAFFNLSLNFAIRHSGSEPQSAPSLVLLTVWELLQSDFTIDHLVTSMCRVFSCVVGRECLLWPVHSLGKTLVAFSLLHFVLEAKLACYTRYLLPSYFCLPVPYNEKDIFWGF